MKHRLIDTNVAPLLLLLFAIGIAGCGNRGPLYLPEDSDPSTATTTTTTTTTVTGEAEEDEDDEPPGEESQEPGDGRASRP